MLRLVILGSGSAGNSALICTGTHRLLIDAGLSAARLLQRLDACGVAPGTLTGIFITHEHGDHCRGLEILTRKHPMPILCNARTQAVLRDNLGDGKHWHVVPGSGEFSFAGLHMETFPVPHDAADPVGLVIRHGVSALGILSDVGHVNPLMRRKMQDLDTLFVEANYDGALLQADTRRPWSTKQRIQGRHGHLSNEQTAAFVHDVLTPRLERVILGHLSQDCNTPDLAALAVRTALHARDRHDVHVCCAPAHEPTAWFPVRQRAAPPPAPCAEANAGAGAGAGVGGEAGARFPATTLSVPVVPGSGASWMQLELL